MGSNLDKTQQQGFGTAPVFFTSISTILGAILFLRFGYAVSNLGLLSTFSMVLVGHLVTIPTAMAISEIATNQKVQGGGVYYIISRSFGITIGGSIGISLYLSQAISTAFYIIAFAEAFRPLFPLLEQYGIVDLNLRWITIPMTIGLIGLVMYKGADLGMKTLYIVVAILFISLLSFFIGTTEFSQNLDKINWSGHIEGGDNFFKVLAICFPAFTGIAAGVGLSGDLKSPEKSIPIGTMLAGVFGMVIYLLVAYKLSVSASLEDLAENTLIMTDISFWGPLIPIGLAAAALSSAIGSILVAPRTLQAIAEDQVLPNGYVNKWLSKIQKGSNEPVNSSLITSIITLIFVLIGDIDVVAQIITMFFMVTYGAICLISFLEHFASDPAYRPVFKSRPIISLVGALMCGYLMFKISATYTFIALIFMALLYQMVRQFTPNKEGLKAIFQGVIFQLSRQFQIFLQKTEKDDVEDHWRPAVVCVSRNTFKRFSAFNLVRWIAHKYGFATYIHLIDGYLSKETNKNAEKDLQRLIKISEASKSKVYLDTMISPSMTSVIAQVIQLPSVAGKDNNMLMFEFSKKDPDDGLKQLIDNFKLMSVTGNDICVLGSDERNFGVKTEIHIWLTPKDLENANLMILLGFIIIGHPEWKKAKITLLACFPEPELEERRSQILDLIKTGRLPISKNNVRLLTRADDMDMKTMINQESRDADLTIIGIRLEAAKKINEQVFYGYDDIGDVLFIHTAKRKDIS
ncbi:amino acid permease [Flammeovirga yaeyamensis]|uniref:Amino acid permease n=1 Tax=Flammeovirga yaeyamensis TaxID=367791 RepID=A0AAX1N8I5_9BACT|nr:MULTISPECIES: amino acid permease [Flammeovirga]ANQ48617.1 amino acid permease [Flammeovirga sp. MY04]MBB3698701.1 amino acid transporter [Flammeovirga yaeyamensis]NMF37288.1 amino acid permease [Flammeovirga yaeyamensis]QWG03894.1 amino acid permease [Flammeovirga yaeyamensis]